MCIFLSAYLILEFGMPYWILTITIPLLVPAWYLKIRMYKNRYANSKHNNSTDNNETVEMSKMESPRM
jgi:hypothetical protein